MEAISTAAGTRAQSKRQTQETITNASGYVLLWNAMASPVLSPVRAFLVIDSGMAEPQRVNMDGNVYRLGRASTNDLCFAYDTGLSREHLTFTRRGGQWFVRDLGSANGTLLNGTPLLEALALKDGDRIAAGHLAIRFYDGTAGALPAAGAPQMETISTDLQGALRQDLGGTDHWSAVLHASRELVSYRPLEELFQVILDLAVNTAGAAAAALMTHENGELITRARHGQGLRISNAVVDRVMSERVSLLIRDTALDAFASGRESIIAGKIKSIVAVPLQTEKAAIGLIYADLRGHRSFTNNDLNLLTVLANVAAIRIEQARLIELEQGQRLLARDLEQAAEIQRSLLPGAAPAIEGFDLAGFNAASRTVGGDYYDIFELPNGKVCLIIADVAGKGMPAALLMSSLHARVGVIFDGTGNLAESVERLNRAVCGSCPPDRFITFFIGVLDPSAGQIEYCNAGHNSPFIVKAVGETEFLESTGAVLGISPAFQYESRTCRLSSGDVLVLYSDGVTEAFSPEGEEFGERRLAETVCNQPAGNAAEIVAAVRKQVANFTAGVPLGDDLTLVVCRRN